MIGIERCLMIYLFLGASFVNAGSMSLVGITRWMMISLTME
jgi:hypothetical protein